MQRPAFNPLMKRVTKFGEILLILPSTVTKTTTVHHVTGGNEHHRAFTFPLLSISASSIYDVHTPRSDPRSWNAIHVQQNERITNVPSTRLSSPRGLLRRKRMSLSRNKKGEQQHNI